jgi:dihydroxyacetone kinase-like protein
MFDLEQAQQFIQLLAERLTREQPRLDKLDSAIGDGDHGSTMARAFQAAARNAASNPGDLGALFDAVSQSIAESAGGAIGPLLAAFFAEAGSQLRGRQSAETVDLLHFMTDSLEAMQEVGGACPGEKTLLDSLAPAVDAFASCQAGSLENALQAAVTAGQLGAESTRELFARHGRAHFLGERSKGTPDPGAVSMSILLETLLEAVRGKQAQPQEQSAPALKPPPGKLINDPGLMIFQDNEGLALAYPELVALNPDGILNRKAPKERGKVGLAIGHGGGHTPSMGGFIGPGLLDADVYGPLFTCASGVRITKAIQAADRGAGVALLVSNHSGDVLNARLAVRRARQLGLQVEPILLGDDIATAPRAQFAQRRGLGGLLFALKIGGAAAEMGWDLPEVVRVMERTNQRTATLAVAVGPPIHPITGEPLFDLPAGQIEVGTGVHGEVGVYRGPHLWADELVDLLVKRLVDDLQSFPEKRLLVLLNGSGGTSRMELHILFRRVFQNLAGCDFVIQAGVVDSLFTTQEMGGFSLSLCALDEELSGLWEKPAAAPCFRWPRT